MQCELNVYLVEVANKTRAFLLGTLDSSQVSIMKVTLTIFHDQLCQQSDTQLQCYKTHSTIYTGNKT
jgi:hypothetical protein